MANQVRVYGTLDTLVLSLYYVSPNLIVRAAERKEVEGMRVEGTNLHIESAPVARVSLPISTAIEMVALIVQQTVHGAPLLQKQMERLAATINAITSTVAQPGTEAPHGEPSE